MKHLSKKIVAVLLAIAMLSSLSACFLFEEEHVHDYSEWGSNKTHHWKYCPEDQERDENSLEKHSDANVDGKCDDCGYDVGLPHVHEFTEWASDAENHWKICPTDKAKDETSVAPHADEDKDGKCDVCGQDTAAPTEASTSIELVDGVPTLVVKGPLDENAGCVKLHVEANGTHHYWNNLSKFANSYEFKVALSELPVDGTPWCWFHIYAYISNSPAALETPDAKIDLPRGAIETTAKYEYDGISYEIIAQEGSDQLVIQPKKIPNATVTSIKIEIIEGKPTLIVNGVVASSAKIASLMLHADGNDGDQFFGDVAIPANGEFTLTFDLSQTPVEGTPWLWFHVYTYDSETAPTPETNYTQKMDLARGDLVSVGTFIDANGIRYTVQNNNQLVIQPTVAPTMKVESITVEKDADGKPYLVVKGIVPTDVLCIKLHADADTDAGKKHYFADNISTKSGEFEFRFDMTKIPTKSNGDTWAWFHIYTYNTAEPTDLETCDKSDNLLLKDFLKDEAGTDYNNANYSIAKEGNYDMVVVVVKKAEVTEKTFNKVTEAQDDWSGTYLFVWEDNNQAFNSLYENLNNPKANGYDVTITDGKIKVTDGIAAIAITIEKVEGGYKLKTTDGRYLSRSANQTGYDIATTADEAGLVTIVWEDGAPKMTGAGGAVYGVDIFKNTNRFAFINTKYVKPGEFAAVAFYKLG